MATIPSELWKKFEVQNNDVDTLLFLTFFNEPEKSKILIVGSHDEPSANILSYLGNDVTGIDLREYDSSLPICNYKYIRGNFCELPKSFYIDNYQKFDIFVSISTIEHFGLGTYKEDSKYTSYDDVIAMRIAYDLLKPDGKAYITIPTGASFIEAIPHYRIYDFQSIQHRLLQRFKLKSFFTSISGPIVIQNKLLNIGDKVPVIDHMVPPIDCGISPHLSSLAILEK